MNSLTSSAMIKIHEIITDKNKNGEYIYNFSFGDLLLANHFAIREEAIRAIETKFVPYPPITGILELRKLASKWMNDNYQTNYNLDNCLVTCGGKFAIFALMQILIQENDEVLIPAPYWQSYPAIVKLCRGTPKIIQTSFNNNWKITKDDLLKNISTKTRILIFNNACNPTGALYTKEEIQEILEIAKIANLRVISDEVYSALIYDNAKYISCGSFSKYLDRVIVVQSCSKNFGMTGWRVGFVFGPEAIIKRLAALQGQSITNTSLISQYAAIGALKNYKTVNTYVRNTMQERLNLFVETYNSLFPISIVKPPSSIYVFVPLAHLGIEESDSIKFCIQLLEQSNIAILPGILFGKEGYVRISFATTKETITEGLKKLHGAIRK